MSNRQTLQSDLLCTLYASKNILANRRPNLKAALEEINKAITAAEALTTKPQKRQKVVIYLDGDLTINQP